MISIIVAEARNKVIGKGGEIPWQLPLDLKHFATITRAHTVIMGRKTYESILHKLGHVLPKRQNVVITTKSDFQAPGCTVIHSVTEAIRQFQYTSEEVFVIGGSEIYKQFLPVAKKMYITEILINCDGDAFFPKYSSEDWELMSVEKHRKDAYNPHGFTFLEFKRKE